MGFYEELSRHYDAVFPAKAGEMRFIDSIAGGRRMLDVGCGTGNKTALLAKDGRTIAAIDLDPEMIETARRRHPAPGVEYRALDMMRIAGAFPGASFDSAICLGNTLAHIVEPEALRLFLESLRRVLAPAGVFATQILNYDRILDRGVSALPDIRADGVVFLRRYEWRGGAMRFVTSLAVDESGETYENDVILRPIRKAELADALATAGFERVDYYGGYDGSPLSGDSFHLIAAARAE